MSSNLPTSAFEILLPKLIAILELTQPNDGDLHPQARQALLQTTNEFKDALNNAKSLVNSLPGAELLIEDQNDVITILERLRDKKREQLHEFSQYIPAIVPISTPNNVSDVQMEVDSMASTPGQ